MIRSSLRRNSIWFIILLSVLLGIVISFYVYRNYVIWGLSKGFLGSFFWFILLTALLFVLFLDSEKIIMIYFGIFPLLLRLNVTDIEFVLFNLTFHPFFISEILLVILLFIKFLMKKESSAEKIPSVKDFILWYSLIIMSGGALIAGLLTQTTVFGNMKVAVISSIGQTVLPALVFLVIYKSIRKKETCYNLLKVGYWAFALNVFLGLYTFASGSTMIDVFTKRMSFNFLGPNIYASVVQLFIPISFFYIYNSNTAFKRILYYIAFVIIVLSMIFTMSRGGALSLLIGIVLLGILNRQVRSPLKKISAIFIITIFAVLPYVIKLFSRFFNIFTNSRVTEFSTLIRTSAWKASLDGAMRYPLGIGGNQFPLLWADLGRFPSELVLHSHNLMLGILVEYGLITFVSFLVFIGIIIKKLYHAALNLKVKKEKLFSATLLVSIITYIIMGTVSEGPRCHLRQNGDLLNHGIIFFYIFLAVGLKFVNLTQNEKNSSVDSSA